MRKTVTVPVPGGVDMQELDRMLAFWGERVNFMVMHGSREGVKEAAERLDFWFELRDALREEMDNEHQRTS